MNARFGVEFLEKVFEVVLLILTVLVILLWFDLKKEIEKNKRSYHWLYMYDFMIAGCIAHVIERMGGRYTLDYLSIAHVGILDTVDMYYGISTITMIVFFTSTPISN